MKLIYCPDCGTIINLDKHKTQCRCQASWGVYEDDGYNAYYGGKAIPIGILNKSFFDSIKKQPELGSGKIFTAFTIPKLCSTFVKHQEA